jgi:Transposase C of IS166 homeodomain/zinc-finger binding domain of transposase IS66
MALTPVPGIDLESLPAEARLLIETLAAWAQEADRLEEEIGLLREMLRLERLNKYGPKGEKLSEEQVELLELEPGFHALDVQREAEVSSRRKRLTKREHAGRNALPAHLPRRKEIIAVEGEERLCVRCGEERRCIGYEEKEVLEIEPARYFVRVIKREKLACHQCPEDLRSWKKASSPTRWSSMCSSRSTLFTSPFTGRPSICGETAGSTSRAARRTRPSWPQASCRLRWSAS